MLVGLIRSVILGAIIAAILLLVLPRLAINHSTPNINTDKNSVPFSFNAAVRRAAPAVVNVYSRNLYPEKKRSTTILGSGVIMNAKGYILTNRHVINDADQIIIALQDGRLFEGILVGSDKLTDLAVLKISAVNLPVIPTNAQRSARIGDLVMAIGNPYNLGQTVTQGIISATGRVGLNNSGRQNFLQTDASINRGNSGGALINSLGELMGINTLTFDKSSSGETPEGIGFAIPTALATKIMSKLIRDGRVVRGFIGITSRDLLPISNKSSHIEPLGGILVSELSPAGPADKAGVKVNDILLKVDGKPALSAQETMDQVAEIRPGSTVDVEIRRNDETLRLPVIIEAYPDSD